jgi:hypothetical protein
MPSPKILDPHRWKKEAVAYAENLLSGLSGEAREEIEAALGTFTSGIRSVQLFVQKIRGFDDVELAESAMHEMIHDLRTDYGITDTEPLEKIQQELAEWLHEHRMKQHPGQAHSPAPGR